MSTTAADSTRAAPGTRPLTVALASFIGTAIEWYDYFIYSMAAGIVFGPLFFPEFSATVGTLAAFATFSVGFLARPLGGIVMGHFGDRVGRRSMLVVSLLMVGVATAGIGLLPTYQAVGVAAPVLLVTLRLVQGAGVGGEWGGAVLMAVEHAKPGRRGFYGSFPQMGTPAGLILANLAFLGVSASVSDEAFAAWGWRIPFLASALLVVVGLVIRLTLPETPEFTKVKSTGTRARLPVVAVLRRNPGRVLLAAGGFAGQNAIGYIFIAYLLSYTTTVLSVDRSLMLGLTLIGTVAWLVAIPWASAMSDRYGRRRVLGYGSAGLAVWVLALFPLVNTASPALILLALVVTAAFLGVTYGPIAALFSELFDTRVRYSGASLGYQIGSILGGGLAPTVAAALYAGSGSSTPVGWYLFGMAVVGLVCLLAATRYAPDTETGTRTDLPSASAGTPDGSPAGPSKEATEPWR